jgi:hypothetical protein
MVIWPLSGSLGNRAGGAAFVEMPGASVTYDPAGPADPFNPSSIPGRALPTEGNGYGLDASWASFEDLGSLGTTYDWVLNRWLPVRPQFVSPDGSHYVYTEFGVSNRIHVVNIATGSDQVVFEQGRFVATAYEHLGITLVHIGPQINGIVQQAVEPDGLWLLDPTTGHTRQVNADSKYWGDVSSGFAWRRDGSSLLRLDLSSGDVSTWAQWPGLDIQVIGFDAAGNPVVDTRHSDLIVEPLIEEWVAARQNNPTMFLSVTNSAQPTEHGIEGFSVPTAIGDEHGVWLEATWGLYLYSASETQKISPLTGKLVGGCQ